MDRFAPIWVVYSQPMVSRTILYLLALILSGTVVCLSNHNCSATSHGIIHFSQTESPVALPCWPMTSTGLKLSKTLHGLLMWVAIVLLSISGPNGRSSNPTTSPKLSIEWEKQQAMKRVCDIIASHSPERARKGYKQCTLHSEICRPTQQPSTSSVWKLGSCQGGDGHLGQA